MMLKLHTGVLLLMLNCFATELLGQIEQVNSPYDEKLPIYSPDGRMFYFVRGNHPENIGGEKDKGDIWYSQLNEDGSWSTPVNAGRPLNTSGWNGIIGFSNDGETMYLYNHYSTSGRPKSQGISISVRNKDGWTFPEPLDIEYFLTKSELYGISLSQDKKIMMMSLESFGSYGAEDIYVSFLQPTGKWSQPRNLGIDVNTKGQELTPYLMGDNKTLLFSSNGLGGYGSLDVFRTTRLDDTWQKWSKPENLTDIINSEGKEYAFRFLNEKEAIFVTTQNSDGYGDIRIRRFDQQELEKTMLDSSLFNKSSKEVATLPTVDLKNVPEIKELKRSRIYGTVNNGQNNTPLAATIRTYKDDSLYHLEDVDEDGNYTIEIESEGVYKFEVESEGFIKQYEEFNIENLGDFMEMNYNLFPLEVGTTMKLDHVHFYQSTADLIETSYTQLDMIVNLMKEHPELEIELSGHTDNRGSPKLNIQLSNQRVKAVKEYLVAKGIDEKRIRGRGYGGTRPIASNASEETRKLNRRVEFTIVKN